MTSAPLRCPDTICGRWEREAFGCLLPFLGSNGASEVLSTESRREGEENEMGLGPDKWALKALRALKSIRKPR